MSTALKTSMINNAVKDGTGDKINGSEVDANPNTLADVLDGTTSTDLGGAGAVDFLALRSITLDNAAASIKRPYTVEWDPADGANLTDNSSGLGILFKMPDDADNQDEFAALDIMVVSDATGAEEGELSLKIIKSGTLTEVMTVASGVTTLSTGLTVGVDGTGYDVKFFGDTTGAFSLYDQSANTQIIQGATAAGAGTLKLSTGELTNVDGGVLGRIDFQAPLDSAGTDAILVGASIWAEVDDTFSASLNDTDLVFAVAESEAALERMRLAWDGTTTNLHFAQVANISSTADITLTPVGDVNLPANIGLTFGNDGEKIEGDGTDLTISGNNINLTAVADVVIPANVGLTFGTGEKIEGDSTDLTVTSGGAINLTAVTDVVIPANVGITFGAGEKIEGDSTDLTVTSGGAINLTAVTDVVIPANVGITFGTGEKIEGDSTDLTVTSGGAINLTAVTDVVIPANVGLTFGTGEKIEGDNTDLTVTSGGLITLTATGNTVVTNNAIVSGTLGAGATTVTTIGATAITGSGILSIDDVTDTTSGVSGSIHTDGGVGIAKKLWVGTTSTLLGNTIVGKDATPIDAFDVSSGTANERFVVRSYSTVIGAGTGVAIQALNDAANATTLLGIQASAITLSGDVTLADELIVDDVTDTSSGITGSIHTDGGVGIAKKLYVGTTSTLIGNVGIGTSAPASVAGFAGAILEVKGAQPVIVLNDTGTGTPIWEIGSASNTLQVYRDGAQLLTLNSSGDLAVVAGNVGIGGTPSAWASASKVLQIGNTNINEFSSVQASFGLNYYYDGANYVKIANDEASRYTQINGTHTFNHAAIGTGNFSWSTSMTIDASGNVGIGTASPTLGDFYGSTGVGLHIYDSSAQNTTSLHLSSANTGATNSDGFGLTQSGFDTYLTNWEAANSGKIYFATGGANIRMTLDSAGMVLIGDTTNANMTQGLTINQGANNDNIFALKSSTIDHGLTTGVTGIVEIDDFFVIAKNSATLGGTRFNILAEDAATASNWHVECVGGTADTTKTASGVGLITFDIAEHDDANGVADVTADGNVFVVRARASSNTGARFIVDEDGDLFADSGSSTAAVTVYDAFDDVELIRSFSLAVGKNTIANKWDSFLKYNEDTLVELGILGAPLADKPLYCVTKLQKVQNGAIEQLYTKLLDMVDELTDTKNRLQSAESKLTLLGA